MPLKYYCPKCEKRFIDWGAEKLGFKCPTCTGETLFRVGTHPEGEDGAPSLSKGAAKRKLKPKAKIKAEVKGEFGDEVDTGDSFAIDGEVDALDVDVVLEDDDGEAVLGDSLLIDED